MKVVMMCPYPVSDAGYVNPYHKSLAHQLSQNADIELHVITFGNQNTQFNDSGVTVHVLKRRLRAFLMIPAETLCLKHEILKINPDIVHVQSTGFPYCTAAVCVRKRYPTLLTVHGIWVEMAKFQEGFSSIFLKYVAIPLEKLAIAKLPNIIALCDHSKNRLSRMTNAKIHVIPQGIAFESISNIRPHLPARHPSVFFIGGLDKRKGVDTLLKATQAVKTKAPEIHVYIAGSGPQEAKLKVLVKELRLERNVEFLGHISDDEKFSYYKSADICVIPSLWEGMPTVLFEAMICGKPVIASNIEGVLEVSGNMILEDQETGLLFEPGNIEDLAGKIVILLQDQELREKMGKTAERKIKEFSWEKIAEKTINVYREILSGPMAPDDD